GYIFKWLIAYSALLGSVGGILICDYFVIRRTRLNLPGLYTARGPYWYVSGFNMAAIIALVLGIAPCAPGFIGTITKLQVSQLWMDLYNYAWFISFAVSFVVYLVLMQFSSNARRAVA
ncbi:MAG TPA: cytosine permease, partial [Phycisphaerae bacterium]|nr:cytosine permease [Phycisphaerae bacterium]